MSIGDAVKWQEFSVHYNDDDTRDVETKTGYVVSFDEKKVFVLTLGPMGRQNLILLNRDLVQVIPH